MMRIKEHPILEFNKGKTVTFRFNGREMEGCEGEPIAAALHAAGIRVLSFSRVHKRPRGFWCAIGNCSSCNMRVNGVPNVRTCVEPLQAGMNVEIQQGKGEIGGDLDQ
jgi:predicted molibdopterin-dependent oxidoreductase YjgC